MTLNTYVAGNPGEARSFAQELRKLGGGTETAATGAHRARSQAEGEWEGAASEAFQSWAKTQGTDGDALAEVYPSMIRAYETWADELDTAQARMEQAKQVARDGELTVRTHTIMPPTPFTAVKPDKPQGRMSAAESERYSNDMAAFEGAQARHAKQQAAYQEAKATIEGARQKERSAHEAFMNALDAVKTQLKGIGQSEKWAQVGVRPASAAAAGLAQAATAMESSSAAATKSMLEGAIGNPAAVNAAWSSMSSAQRADLIDRFPKMVGSTDGVPATARHEANMGVLASQKATLAERYRLAAKQASQIKPGEGMQPEKTRLETEAEQAREALDALEQFESKAKQDDYYLLDINATSDGRGQAIIAHGNPDTAQNVLTTVPGTSSDLGSAINYVDHNDEIMRRAQEMKPGESFSAITYTSYEAPPSLLDATNEKYANQGKEDLAQFQEGLRATHQLDEPSNNTVVGHSYGSTQVGYAARDHGLDTDNIVLIGSPGVGVDHASDLGVNPDNVWAGTSTVDPIDFGTPSIDPLDYWPNDDSRLIGSPGGEHKDLWFGRDPNDDGFGARDLPVNNRGFHSSYWTSEESLDGMARVVAGNSRPPAQHQ